MATEDTRPPGAMTVSVEDNGDPAARSSGAGGRVGLVDDLGQDESILVDPQAPVVDPAAEAPAVTTEEPAAVTDDKPAAEGDDAPLGDFDPANPDVVTKYDKAFFTDAGEMNFDRFTSEFDGNAKDGHPGKLNEGTYAYIAEKFGLPKDRVDDICEGLQAKREKITAAFFEPIGGKPTWDKAIAWGSEKYTDAQKASLNAALKKGGQDALDARDLLITRFKGANPETPAAGTKVPQGRPRVTPRTVTERTGVSAPATEGFATPEEGQKALVAARNLKGAARDAAFTEWNRKDAVSAYNKR